MAGPTGCVSCSLQVRVRFLETSGLTKLLEELKEISEAGEERKTGLGKMVGNFDYLKTNLI